MSSGQIDELEKYLLGLMLERQGWYDCPKDPSGRRLGPLVGYAARDGQGRQLVGDCYFNFAMGESSAKVLSAYARAIMDRHNLKGLQGKVVLCGMPMGGLKLATALELELGQFRDGIEGVYMENVYKEPTQPGGKPGSELKWGRHSVQAGDSTVLVEDVANNFATTGIAISHVESRGAEVVGVACALNRSMVHDEYFTLEDGRRIPIFAAIRCPFPSSEQDDPPVAEDVAAGNVVFEVKKRWSELRDAMARHAS